MQKPVISCLVFVCVAFATGKGQGETVANSLCEAQELTLFSCPLKARKLVSLCASASFPAANSTLQYRFGSLGRVEFQYPEVATNGKRHFFYSATGYSGGGESHVRFANGEYDYILFERTVRTQTKETRAPHFSSGVISRKAGKTLAIRTCLTGGFQTSLDPHLPAEEFEYIDDLP